MAVEPLTGAPEIRRTDDGLGAQIRSLRLRAGLSQSELAAGLCSRTYIAQIEADRRFPKAALLAQLAARLGTDLATLSVSYLQSPMVNAQQCLAIARELAIQQALDMAQTALATAERLYELEGRPVRLRAKLEETRGLIRFRMGDLESARHLLESALALHERAPTPGQALSRARLALGLILCERGELNQALRVLMPAISSVLAAQRHGAPGSHPYQDELWCRIIEALGHLALRLRRPHVALFIFDLTERLELADRSPMLSFYRALAEIAVGDLASAGQRLEGLLTAGREPNLVVQVHTNLGVLGRLQGDWIRAQHHLTTAWYAFERLGAGDPRAIANELARCALQQGQLEQAEAWLREAHSRPDEGSSANLAETYWLTGRLARLRDDTDGAQEGLARAMEATSADQSGIGMRQLVRIERLRLAISLGQADQALALLDDMEADLQVLAV